MQGSFLKKLGSGLRKNASRYSSILINSSFPVKQVNINHSESLHCNFKQHVQVSVSLHDHIPSRSFSEKSTHEKVANYENLVASISNAADHQALVNVVSQNLPHFKNEHIVLTLRIFARLMKGPATAELQELVRNEQFRSLVAKAQESIERLNDYGISHLISSNSLIFLQKVLICSSQYENSDRTNSTSTSKKNVFPRCWKKLTNMLNQRPSISETL